MAVVIIVTGPASLITDIANLVLNVGCDKV